MSTAKSFGTFWHKLSMGLNCWLPIDSRFATAGSALRGDNWQRHPTCLHWLSVGFIPAEATSRPSILRIEGFQFRIQ
jgi:hypothetical protein